MEALNSRVTLILVAFGWMYFLKIDIVVKSTGMFRMSEDIYRISCETSGIIQSESVSDGLLVKTGDILYTIENETLDNNIQFYQERLEALDERLDIMNAYIESLDGESDTFDGLTENTYYLEFQNRSDLFYGTVDYNKQDIEDQKSTYVGSVDAISKAMEEYENKIDKFEKTIACIRSKTDEFGTEDAYYGSIVNSYVSSFNLTALQYNNQLSDYNEQLGDYNDAIQKAKDEGVLSEAEIDELEESRDQISTNISSLQAESWQALNNLELQQISSVEQQIESLQNTIISLESNLTTAQLQLDSIENVDTEISERIQILTEKENVNAEILSYQNEKDECENHIETYVNQQGNCQIIANTDGFFYSEQDFGIGTTIQEGTVIGQIYPENASDYFAEVYVENQDIGKLEIGQEVKFEISAFPSNEYGYFTGTIENISKNITINQNTGSMYYIVKVSCDDKFVENDDGEVGAIMNGMVCQAKIIIDEQNVLRYLLNKIDLVE